ncbi:MAG: hypothetical protein A2176_16095 [Spirochaetes bacterium RBG_13_51_14]|nr:MAG: hypothetical protein A2176_16095 [Spirochaetes bacterium RBG_13_51_14]
MDNANKIKLAGIEPTESGKKISFASYLKRDYVDKSLVIYLDRTGIIEKIYFSSNSYGTVEWINGAGLKNCHTWESEDEAKSHNYLSKRYTAILSDGAAAPDYARTRIIPDILDYMDDADSAEWISDILNVREYLVPVDVSRFGP